MAALSIEPKSNVVVGVSFNPDTKNYLSVIQRFAEYTKTKPRLVHASEPLAAVYPNHLYGTSLGYDLLEEIARENFDESKNKLSDLVANMEGVDASFGVKDGVAADVLLEEAKATNANLIVCSTGGHSYHFVPKGLSTALTLASESDIPVMVIPRGTNGVFQGEWLRTLLADSLTDSCFPAIEMLRKMAHSYPKLEIHHFHGDARFLSGADSFLQKILDRMNIAEADLDKEKDKARAYIGNKLAERIALTELLKDSDSDYVYTQHIVFGDLLESLGKLISQIKPDVLVMGRHRIMHTNPVGMGKMPFYAMFSLGLPVLIVP